MSPLSRALLDGAIAMGSVACGLFFLRFWRKTRDRLFAYFALAFALLGVNRVLIAFAPFQSDENAEYIYGIRLVAFCLILYAIWEKNRSPR